MLSRNQYTIIAHALRDTQPEKLGREYYQWERDVIGVADALAYESPQFRYDIFLDDCDWHGVCPSCGGRLSITLTCLSFCVHKTN